MDESLTVKYEQWIRKITRRMWSRYKKYYDYDELLAIANLAAFEAESRYDPTKAKFSAYIKPRVEGAIIRSVSVISNSHHKVLAEMYRFIEAYVQQHDVAPPQHVILEHLKIDEIEFLALLDTILKVTIVSPDDLDEDDLAHEMDLDTVAEYARVSDIIATLPMKQQKQITEFMDDNKEPSEDLKVVLDILRSKLGVELDA